MTSFALIFPRGILWKMPNRTAHVLWVVKLFNLLDLLHPLSDDDDDVFINSFRLFVKLFTLLWWKCARAYARRLLGDVQGNWLALLLSCYWIKDENLLLTRLLLWEFRIFPGKLNKIHCWSMNRFSHYSFSTVRSLQIQSRKNQLISIHFSLFQKELEITFKV